MANLDMEPLNIMGELVSGWKKPTLKPPVVEILIFTEKTQMFQINGNLDIYDVMHSILILENFKQSNNKCTITDSDRPVLHSGGF